MSDFKFEQFNPTDESRSCVPRTFTKLTGKPYDAVKLELTDFAESLGFSDYSNPAVFEPYMKQYGFDKLQDYDDFRLKDLQLENGTFCILTTDKNGFFHLLPVLNNTIFDRRNDSLELFVVSVYKKTGLKVLSITGKNHFENWTESRTACRGLIIKEGKILLTYETKNDGQYMIPGGGLEKDETETECLKREIAEETGLLVEPSECMLEIDEYYEEWKFISLYYFCKPTGETCRNLTEREKSVGMELRWIPVNEAIDAFSKYNDYAATDEIRRGLYLREYTALKEIL